MKAFIDIGELSFSLYLSGHLRWRKRHLTEESPVVLAYPERAALYEGLATPAFVGPDFSALFAGHEQECFQLRGIKLHLLLWHAHTARLLPPNAEVVPPGAVRRAIDSAGQAIYKPYPAKRRLHLLCILVFPRCRPPPFSCRNLPVKYYENLLAGLCALYPAYHIVAVGTARGAYDIHLDCANYANLVGVPITIQDLVDLCGCAVAAVGGQSAPPKITLLQSVPTFIVGHEDETAERENWSRTPMGIYLLKQDGYESLDIDDCLAKSLDFVGTHKKTITA